MDEPPHTARNSSQPARPAVLLVDDYEPNLVALDATLDSLDLVTVRALSGEEALQRVAEREFAVILLDVQMKGLDGLATAARIRQLERSRDVPILFLTAFRGDEHDVMRGYELGAVDYVTKPFQPEVLRAKVASLVDLWRRAERLRAREAALHARERREAEESLRRSEQRFRAVFDQSLDGMILADDDAHILDANPAACELLGTTRERFLSGAIFDIVPSAQREDTRAQWRAFVRDGRQSGEMRLVRADGQQFLADYRAIANVLPGVHLSVIRDVTDRRHAERALAFIARASEVLASSLDFEHTLAAVARLAVPDIADWAAVDMLDEQGSIKRLAVTHVEPQKVELAAELARRWPMDPNAPSGVPHVLRTGQPEVYPEISDELLVATVPDPELLEIVRALGFRSSMCVPLRVRGRAVGAITFVVAESGRNYGQRDVVLAEDLARRASIAVDNALLYREAVEANRLKDEFVSTLSHELRTPLTAIVGWVGLMRARRDDAATIDRGLDVIERNANSQARLVEDVLDVSRIVTGKLRLDLERVNFAELISAAIEAVGPSAVAKGVTLSSEIQNGMPTMMGDAGRLQQVVWNLLTNAIRFTPRGGRVIVRSRTEGSAIHLEVADTGQGIDRAVLPFIFDRFRQGDSSSTRAHGGLGLGLAIVRHLVEMHGGTVRAESEGIGHGATFTVTLPIRAVAEPHTPTVRTRTQPAPPTGAPRLDGVRVLVVDDEADSRELIAELLSDDGAEVRSASSVREALRVLDSFPADAIVSDIGMPREDGYALMAELSTRAAQRGHEVPALALSAYARDVDREKALAAGFREHLAKPADAKRILHAVAHLVGRER
jgi:PAS domain S-box-containing protein